jgi:hypothetical protein
MQNLLKPPKFLHLHQSWTLSAEKTRFLVLHFFNLLKPLRMSIYFYCGQNLNISNNLFSSLNFRVQYLLIFQIKFRVYRAFVLSNHWIDSDKITIFSRNWPDVFFPNPVSLVIL